MAHIMPEEKHDRRQRYILLSGEEAQALLLFLKAAVPAFPTFLPTGYASEGYVCGKARRGARVAVFRSEIPVRCRGAAEAWRTQCR